MELDLISVISDWLSDAVDEFGGPSANHVDLTDLFKYDQDEVEVELVYAQNVLIRQGPPPSRWLSLKSIIIELYGKDRQKLKLWEVHRFMENTYGFTASKKQYKDKLKDWGVRKNERRQAPTARRRRRASSTSNYTMDSEATANDSVLAMPTPSSSMRMLRGHRTLMNLVYYLESLLFPAPGRPAICEHPSRHRMLHPHTLNPSHMSW